MQQTNVGKFKENKVDKFINKFYHFSVTEKEFS